MKKPKDFSSSRKLPLFAALALIGMAIGVTLGVSGCRQVVKAEVNGATPAMAAVPVTAVTAERPEIVLSLPGELLAFQDTEVQAHEVGFIKSLLVDRGSEVGPGHLLAHIEAPDLVARAAGAEQLLSAARARTLQAEANWRRDEGTLAGLRNAEREMAGAVAGNDINIAAQNVAADRSEVASRQAVENAAARDLNAVRSLEAYLRVTAPFGGRIVARAVSVGDLVGPNKPALFRLQQLDRLRLVIDLPEAESAGVQPGAMVPFTVSALPGATFNGRVRRIAESLRPNTRTMPVELDVDNGDRRLAPGMFAQVAWRFQRPATTLFVPSSAVVNSSRASFVEVVRGGRIAWVEVHRGLTMGTDTEVFGALQAGEKVVVRGTEELRPETPVATAASKTE